MILSKIHVLRFAACLVGIGNLHAAADFVAPAEGPVAFRRDKVPLDANTMANLSKQLEVLAASLDRGTAENRRGVAQMLALATALDPSNSSARGLIASFQKGSPQAKSTPDQIAKAQARVWQLIGWLETPEAGNQGKALAACLVDVMVISDPKNPQADALHDAGERGAWAGWIPDRSAYEPKVLAQTREAPPKDAEPVVKSSGVKLTKARVRTVLWRNIGGDKAANWVLAAAPLSMSAEEIPREDAGPPDFLLTILTSPDGRNLEQLAGSLQSLLQKQYGKLPSGWGVTIDSKELQQSSLSGKRQSISAAAAVLASAAITGIEPDATIIGLVDGNGAFKLPVNFWDQLNALGKGNGERLILPAAAAEYLPALLAFENARFFLDHEVVLAANFQELLDLSAKVSKESITKISARFQEIRSKAGTQPVNQYVDNPFIRRRLADLSQEAPYHYSAKMLAIQGAGNRPTLIPRTILIPELRNAVAPIAWILTDDGVSNLNLKPHTIALLTQTYESCRTQVERLARYVQKDDREIFDHVKALVAAIQSMERAARARGADYLVEGALATARDVVIEAYGKVEIELGDGSNTPATAPAN
ncbi:MAG: hypothetical protein ABI600_02705 [Luteolibacter sp.]